MATKMDADKNGCVTVEEFKTAKKEQFRKSNKPNMKNRLNRPNKSKKTQVQQNTQPVTAQ